MIIKTRDRGLEARIRELRKRLDLRAGVFGAKATDTYPNGMTVGEVAERHELGIDVPQRSWLRGWLDQESADIGRTLAQAARQVASGQSTMQEAFSFASRKLLGSLRGRILSRIAPPNAPRTLKRKQGNIPLIDTRRFLYALDVQVEKK